MSEWISVNDERKPRKLAEEHSQSVQVLLYIPSWGRQGDPVAFGHYYHASQVFRPSGCNGDNWGITHWMYKPEPPKIPAEKANK